MGRMRSPAFAGMAARPFPATLAQLIADALAEHHTGRQNDVGPVGRERTQSCG